MNGFSEQDFGVLARVLDSLTAMVNLKNHYDVYSAVEHAFRVCLEEEAQFAKLIGDEPNSWRAGLRLLHEFATEYKDSLQNQQYEELDEPGRATLDYGSTISEHSSIFMYSPGRRSSEFKAARMKLS